MKIILSLIAIALLSCNPVTTTTTNTTELSYDLSYFKDERTGLCFATLTSINTAGSTVSITCVPCDSITLSK